MVFSAGPTSGLIATTTTYGDMTEPFSFIDSGSNGYFFDDSTITQCTGASVGLYCPSTTQARSATMLPFNSSINPVSHVYSFTIVDVNSVTGFAADDVGGPSGTCTASGCTCPTFGCSFDWGLPFFYGRKVFTALENTTINGNAGPFFATTP
jgi:hypothetical protein